MDKFSEWQECQIDPSQGMQVPAVHDNFVTALSLDLEQGTLILKTRYEEIHQREEQTDLRFSGVLTHHFNDIMAPSILFDVEYNTFRTLLNEWEWLFLKRKNHGWPLCSCETLPELENLLEERGLQAYRVRGSRHLDGFVIAEKVEYRLRTID
ncbi:hypothetical protein [Gimesia algae]|uniref:Uncharacterized protein n=1 Tax=Gimesia algae TaxID=2527971 RepID=A0A517VKE7_9PLAN|nr:hypothetical protein [Gimesia algae]QDT93488.1 hypothetical protein Pan161_51680 [Gimesia algae]